MSGSRSDSFLYSVCMERFWSGIYKNSHMVKWESIRKNFILWEKSLKNVVIVWKWAIAKSLDNIFVRILKKRSITVANLPSHSVYALVFLTWWSDSARLALNNKIHKQSLVCGVGCLTRDWDAVPYMYSQGYAFPIVISILLKFK